MPEVIVSSVEALLHDVAVEAAEKAKLVKVRVNGEWFAKLVITTYNIISKYRIKATLSIKKKLKVTYENDGQRINITFEILKLKPKTTIYHQWLRVPLKR